MGCGHVHGLYTFVKYVYYYVQYDYKYFYAFLMPLSVYWGIMNI